MEIERDAVAELWPMRRECAACGSVLSVSTDDLDYGRWKVSGYFFDGSAVCEPKFTFRCPACGAEANGNEVPAEQVPLAVREGLVAGDRRES